jgi:hypothetical protein
MAVMLDDADRHSSFRKRMDQSFHQVGLAAVFYPAYAKEQRMPDGLAAIRRIVIPKCFIHLFYAPESSVE